MMSNEVINEINKLKNGSQIIISEIKYGIHSPEAMPKKAYPIVIRISG